MSPPDTKVEKQARRHRPAMAGIIASLAVILLLVVASVFFITNRDAAEDADSVVAPE
ncbi:MAG TPA: hypothetical protein PKA33_18315 [Amaricoccus sp.]|uniref:hypothetical protein n=1 Tax=Amaricoccus sp. TaxID=1872485 RepID=UPI002BEE1B79|nr:hypothetical protein [Amaricoccus sp.]HMQ95047.1 hypothetical protein [Amaricoccus sp.]HMR54294.1 hypothetical protein [Amaricoccus sp.]HMR61878.1 hypothetical protein [Amaricoccus sp.]HMU01301.1 hypothetical protein [Amaricoccus sp.]